MISIILPVYNAERFVGRAVNSVLAQTHKDWELIIVDDGSSDMTAQCLRFYKDKRIRVLTQQNAGVGAARNTGLAFANGDLIFFLDADDYIMPHALEKLYGAYDNCMVVGGVFRQSPDGTIHKLESPLGGNETYLDRVGIHDAIWKYIQTNDLYLVSHCWGRLYEKEVISFYSIKFEETKVGEDGAFNIRYLTCIANLAMVNEPLYCFQQHRNSSSIKAITGDLHDLFPLSEALQNFFQLKVLSFIDSLGDKLHAYADKGHEQPGMSSYRIQTQKDFTFAQIRKSKLPVVIYGADTVGRVLMDILFAFGIDPVCFVDYDPNKHEFRGLPVYRPGLRSYVEDSADCLFIISVMSIGDVVKDLKNWIPGGLLLGDIDTTQTDPSYHIDEEEYQIESCKIAHAAYLKTDYVFLRSVDIVITERCSLRCRDCSNLMQYFEKPVDYDSFAVLMDLENLLAFTDEVLEARVLGGDAFMNAEWPIVVDYLVAHEKVRRVVVYTNGVVMPKNFTALCHDKVIVNITDYGKLSKKLDKLIATFKKFGIWHRVNKVEDWVDCGKIEQHCRSGDQNDELFRNCVATNLLTMMKGKIFRCPFAASVATLGIERHREDFIDVNELNDKKTLYDYINSDKAMSQCDYCTSRILANKIKPAVQVKKPLPYQRKFQK